MKLLLTALLAIGIVVPAATAASQAAGTERLNIVIVASMKSGTRQVLSSVIVARGAFNGIGRIVEVESPPGEEALLDDLVFRSGTMHHVSNVTGFDVAINPRTCVVTITSTSTGAVVGGTGIFEHASGTFEGTLIGKGVVPRNGDGSCDATNPPVTDIEYITETGTLSF